MLILRLCFCLVLISVHGVFGVAVTKGERTESPISTPVPTPTPTSVDGFLKNVQALGLDQADVNLQFITMIKFVTSTATGQCTPTLVTVAYTRRDEKANAWVAVNHGEDAIRTFEPRDEKLEKREGNGELCSLLVKYSMPPCPTLTVTSTFTLPGTPCTASRDSIPKVQNCTPTDSVYKLLIFDDYFSRGNIDPTIPNVSPQEPDPPADSFVYYGMKFSGNFSFIHCEANSLNPESRLAKTCNNDTLFGDYFLSLYSPVSPAPFNGPVKRFITFEGGYFSLVDMLISAFPIPQGALSGVVSVIVKGYTSSDGSAKATFFDVRYVRGGVWGGGETRMKITYELGFYNLLRLEIVALEGEWKRSDGEDWAAEKWKGKGAPLYIDDLAVCRHY
ncbi:hypothetical protein BGX38DRAFT_1275048 [Terfezia claveryi]|nr:hypothetical protein BGX38DRAFT_1275048 [Terfezia claveryi]